MSMTHAVEGQCDESSALLTPLEEGAGRPLPSTRDNSTEEAGVAMVSAGPYPDAAATIDSSADSRLGDADVSGSRVALSRQFGVVPVVVECRFCKEQEVLLPAQQARLGVLPYALPYAPPEAAGGNIECAFNSHLDALPAPSCLSSARADCSPDWATSIGAEQEARPCSCSPSDGRENAFTGWEGDLEIQLGPGGEEDGGMGGGQDGGAPTSGLLVRPCRCGGSMGFLHLQCLQRWIERRRLDGAMADAALRCEVCLTPYRVRVHDKLDLSWSRLCSAASVSFYAEFCTIAATLASMAFLFCAAFTGRKQEQDGSVVALYASLLLVGSVFILGCFTLVRLMARWRGALSVPLLSPENSVCFP